MNVGPIGSALITEGRKPRKRKHNSNVVRLPKRAAPMTQDEVRKLMEEWKR